MEESALSQIYIFSRSVKDFRTGNQNQNVWMYHDT